MFIKKYPINLILQKQFVQYPVATEHNVGKVKLYRRGVNIVMYESIGVINKMINQYVNNMHKIVYS